MVVLDTGRGQSTTKQSESLDSLPPIVVPTRCAFCEEDFPSRSALFRHLRRQADGCSAPREDSGEKVMIIFGYKCWPQLSEEKRDDGPRSVPEANVAKGGDTAGNLILEAMAITGFSGQPADSVTGSSAKPVGYSQASAIGARQCRLLAQEQGISATADTACLRAPTTVPTKSVRAWLSKTNEALEGTGVQLFGRMPVPPELHAEAHATRRRYEYLLPAWLLDHPSDGPWPGPAREHDALIPLLKRARKMGFCPFGSCNFRVGQRRRRCPLWHNFSAEGLPHSPSVARRLFRFYAREHLVLQDVNFVCLSISGDAFVDRQVRGMVALAVAGARGIISSETIASSMDPTKQEDILPVPLAPVAPCWLAEVNYATWQSRLGSDVCMSPGAAVRSAPPLEGWSGEEELAAAVSFRKRMLDRAADWWKSCDLGRGWLHDVLKPGAERFEAELNAANERASGGTASLMPCLSREEKSSLLPAPAVYQEVLRLLREADTSGLWPASSVARDSVIFGDSNAGAESARQLPSALEESSAEENDETDGRQTEGEAPSTKQQAPHGGSFTVGAFPPPCPPPRGNKIFPDLTRAAFLLERLLMPERPPSSTIAINRNARFRPHIDSGSGAGQSISLIVGLGDYVGGDLVVEGETVDIRYQPLEFNGWTQRHWTRPFRGERFSLVWFTPRGCEGLTNGAWRFPVEEASGTFGKHKSDVATVDPVSTLEGDRCNGDGVKPDGIR